MCPILCYNHTKVMFMWEKWYCQIYLIISMILYDVIQLFYEISRIRRKGSELYHYYPLSIILFLFVLTFSVQLFAEFILKYSIFRLLNVQSIVTNNLVSTYLISLKMTASYMWYFCLILSFINSSFVCVTPLWSFFNISKHTLE